MIEVFTETKLNPLMLQKKTNSCYYNKNTDKKQKTATKIGLAYVKFY